MFVVMNVLAPETRAVLADWRAQGLKVVLTNGCFDVLHFGHLALLEAARRSGDRLVVALNSDLSVRALKGEGRPVIPEAERAELLLSLEAVDHVVIYDAPTPIEVIRELRPDVLVKGADWAADAIVGRDEVEASGGRVLRVELVPGRSTSGLLEHIRGTGRDRFSRRSKPRRPCVRHERSWTEKVAWTSADCWAPRVCSFRCC